MSQEPTTPSATEQNAQAQKKPKGGKLAILAISGLGIAFSSANLAGFSRPEPFKQTLENAGHTNIVHTGTAPLADCTPKSGHFFRDSFTATNVRGQKVVVSVCSGLADPGTITYPARKAS